MADQECRVPKPYGPFLDDTKLDLPRRAMCGFMKTMKVNSTGTDEVLRDRLLRWTMRVRGDREVPWYDDDNEPGSDSALSNRETEDEMFDERVSGRIGPTDETRRVFSPILITTHEPGTTITTTAVTTLATALGSAATYST
ncbi:hypothetical protein KPH14_000014, partial [Odynerus spinipes]